MSLTGKCNHVFDKWVSPTVKLAGRDVSLFHICGLAGLTAACGLSAGLVHSQGLSLWVLGGITVVAVATFLALAMLTKILVGEEELTYYHHEVAVLIAVAIGLWMIGQPILIYLDITILGVGAFLIFGRIGCLMVGCCHGQLNRWGVSYHSEHAEAGFASSFVGKRLFPIQLVESLTVLIVVAIGSLMVISGWPPGSALTWYVMSYDLARFFFEFKRGDRGRRYVAGFSEAQWTSIGLMVLVVGMEYAAVLPLQGWHAAATVCLLLLMALVAWKRYTDKSIDYALLLPRHVAELADALNVVSQLAERQPGLANASTKQLHISSTSKGLNISIGTSYVGPRRVHHCTLSKNDDNLTAGSVQALARLIVQLRNPKSEFEIVEAGRGIFHVVMQENSSPIRYAGPFHTDALAKALIP